MGREVLFQGGWKEGPGGGGKPEPHEGPGMDVGSWREGPGV